MQAQQRLAGVDRVFLLTGYTVAMLTQSKTLVDAAKKAGVRHIVHVGVFAEWDTTDAHFAWHQLIEKYIRTAALPGPTFIPTCLWRCSRGCTSRRI